RWQILQNPREDEQRGSEEKGERVRRPEWLCLSVSPLHPLTPSPLLFLPAGYPSSCTRRWRTNSTATPTNTAAQTPTTPRPMRMPRPQLRPFAGSLSPPLSLPPELPPRPPPSIPAPGRLLSITAPVRNAIVAVCLVPFASVEMVTRPSASWNES